MALYMKDTRSVHLLYNTLACLLEAMIDKYTVIDLRNEASVRGKITGVDGYMNVELEDCIFQNPRGELYPFENFFVTCRNIRYVHVPHGCTATDLMKSKLQGEQRNRDGKKKKTFKVKRAKVYQQEILKELGTKEN